MSAQFYSFTAQNPQGNDIQMSDFEGKVILVVNTATQCGLTPQFDGLEGLFQKYKEKDFIVLGFPCNQFAGQEPLSNDDMEATCKLNHGVTFPLMKKIDVNGGDAHPLFSYLKKALPGTLVNSIKWNFTKFLIGKDGTPLKRYSPTTKPESIENDILKALNA
ncbi:glutathione peroxidase [Flammeovirga pacifica]|uniref:Glutathione peroxidase n=1 Tax=Flammeovirga pacifica TaxID=915059 RepID=A0A1S1YXK6_FLAPC|nr:glutathione peroxidase [Flammeovirga pacifica]OHX65710.1 glutathione peroxidase [Flammeovirga pacifica]